MVVSPPLGTGLTAQVFLAECEGNAYALKRFDLSKAGLGAHDLEVLRKTFSAERGLRQGLEHPHIVRLQDEVEVGGDICLALQYAAGGSVRDLMRLPGGG